MMNQVSENAENFYIQDKISHHFVGEIKKNILAKDSLELGDINSLPFNKNMVKTFAVRNLLYTKMVSPIDPQLVKLLF